MMEKRNAYKKIFLLRVPFLYSVGIIVLTFVIVVMWIKLYNLGNIIYKLREDNVRLRHELLLREKELSNIKVNKEDGIYEGISDDRSRNYISGENIDTLIAASQQVYEAVEKGDIDSVLGCKIYKNQGKGLYNNCIYALALRENDLSICDSIVGDENFKWICKDQIKQSNIWNSKEIEACMVFSGTDLNRCIQNWLDSQDKFTLDLCKSLESFLKEQDKFTQFKREIEECWKRYLEGPYKEKCEIPSIVLKGEDINKLKQYCK